MEGLQSGQQEKNMIHLPEQFVNRMRKMLGEEELRAFLSSYDRPMARGLRVNPLKCPETQGRWLTDLVKLYDLRTVPWAVPYGYYYAEDLRPGRSPLHEAGLFYIQEPSAMAVAALSELVSDACGRAGDFGSPSVPETEICAIPADSDSFLQEDLQRLMRREEFCQGEKVLDLCAAPGGKTTMLASAMRGRGLLVANEIDAGRARILSQNVERMGITNALVLNESPEELADRFPAFFDRVLVDAPCSGEGMFRREEQALSMWSEENIARCAARQAQILDCAAGMVKSGGFLIYSTCTFAPEEDEGSVAGFLGRHPEFSVVNVPALLGEERMRAWGFDTGKPEWAGMRFDAAAIAADEREDADGAKGLSRFADPDGEGTRSLNPDGEAPPCAGLAGTIRLWPHRLQGEGHFVAVLQKEGMRSLEAVPAGAGMGTLPSGSGSAAGRSAAGAGRGPESRTGRRAAQTDADDSWVSAEGRAGRGDSFRSSDRRDGKENASDKEVSAFLSAFYAENITADLPGRLARESGSGLVRFGDALWLMPYRDEISTEGLRVLRPGLQFGTVRKGRFEPDHALAMALHPGEAARVLDLAAGAPEASAFLRGESMPCDAALKGWTLVAIGGISAGWGKASGGILKNHYPKGLRRPY